MTKNTKKKEWVVGKDDVGRAILQWTVDPQQAAAPQNDPDPLARTYNFLRRLELPDLSLEGDRTEEDHDPYNSGVYSAAPLRAPKS